MNIHCRVAYVDPGHGPGRCFSIALCGFPDASSLRMLDPVAFGAAAIGYRSGKVSHGYCKRCAVEVRAISDAACERSNRFASKEPRPAVPGNK